MKKIEVSVKQKGCEFISNSSISIKIDGKEVDNNIRQIVWEALEVSPDFEKYDTVWDCGVFGIELRANNNNYKMFKTKIQNKCFVNEWNEDGIIEYFTKIFNFIKAIEKWMEENSSCVREFCFEV